MELSKEAKSEIAAVFRKYGLSVQAGSITVNFNGGSVTVLEIRFSVK